MPAKRIGDLLKLKDNGELGRTLKRSDEIGKLTGILAESLPDELGANLLAASITDEGTLEIRASSSAWAARLRFEAPTLLDALQRAGRTASEVRVRVGKP